MSSVAQWHGRTTRRRLLQRTRVDRPTAFQFRPCQARLRVRWTKSVTASLTSKGRRHKPADLTVKRIMGEGSFGQVFEGVLETNDGPQKVVVKRVKARVMGAEEMGQAEHLLNVYASKVAKGSCADFLGFCEVSPQEATQRLTAGVWLVWRYEGARTLAYYLRRRDTIRALSRDMLVPESAVVPTVMKQICTCIQAFHACGLVHRDIKPLNIIFSEVDRKMKLIDLGACADLRSGTNYKPDESILDPNFCPPEQYVLPTDAPHLSQTPFSMAISPMLWALHKPDRFDSWSAGLVLMQLCVPSLRTDRGLKQFNVAMQRADYDLQRWRLGANLRKSDSELLDAYDGTAWELAQALLRPRRIVYDETTGDVSFVNDGSLQRVNMAESLRHPLMKYACEPDLKALEQSSGTVGQSTVPAPASGTTNVLSNAMGAWRNLTNKLFDLEAQMIVTASATEQASMTLRRLKAAKASAQEVKKAQTKLGLMQDQMGSLEQELVKTSAQAQGLLGFLNFNKPKVSIPDPAGLPPVVGAGSRGSKSGSGASKSGSRGSKASKAAPAMARASAPIPSNPDMWQRMAGQLLKLEDMLLNMSTATEQQTLTVKRLQRDVELGNAEPSLLAKAERVLTRMQRRVDQLQTEYTDLSSEAADILRQANTGSKKDKARQAASLPPPSGSGSSTAKPGSWWARAAKAAPAASPLPPRLEAEQVEAPKGDNTLLAAGMRFTGMMVRFAGDMANMMEKDVEEKKMARAVDAAFVALLKEEQVMSSMAFQEAAARFGGDPRWQAVDVTRRPTLFADFCFEARKREEQEMVQAEARLKALYLRVGVPAGCTWKEIRPKVEIDPAFKAVPDEAKRLQVFEQVMADVKHQELLVTQREIAEDDYRRLLAEVNNPPISSASRWPLVKQQLWNDSRYNVLSERRRQALFQEYQDALAETEVVLAAVAPPAPGPEPAPQAEPEPAVAPQPEPEPVAAKEEVAVKEEKEQPASEPVQVLPGLSDLAELLQQQTVLREEYKKMEARLKEMEAQLKQTQQTPEQPSPAQPSAPTHLMATPTPTPILRTGSMEEEEDSSVVFQFGSNGTKPMQVANRE